LATPNANSGVDLSPASIVTLGGVYALNDRHAISARYVYGDQGVSGDFTMQTKDGSALDAEKQYRYESALASKIAPYVHSLGTYFDTDIRNEKRATSDTYMLDDSEYYYYEQVDSRTKGVELTLKGTI